MSRDSRGLSDLECIFIFVSDPGEKHHSWLRPTARANDKARTFLCIHVFIDSLTTYCFFNHHHACPEYCWMDCGITGLLVNRTQAAWLESRGHQESTFRTWLRTFGQHAGEDFIRTYKESPCPFKVDSGRALLSHILFSFFVLTLLCSLGLIRLRARDAGLMGGHLVQQ